MAGVTCTTVVGTGLWVSFRRGVGGNPALAGTKDGAGAPFTGSTIASGAATAGAPSTVPAESDSAETTATAGSRGEGDE